MCFNSIIGAAIYSDSEDDSDLDARPKKKDKSRIATALRDSDDDDDDEAEDDDDAGGAAAGEDDEDDDGAGSKLDNGKDKSGSRGNQIESDEGDE